jgi:hypothetical protein
MKKLLSFLIIGIMLVMTLGMVSAATYGPIGPNYAHCEKDYSGDYECTSQIVSDDTSYANMDAEEEIQARWNSVIPTNAVINNVKVYVNGKETESSVESNIQLWSSDTDLPLTEYQDFTSTRTTKIFQDSRLTNEVQNRVSAGNNILLEVDFEGDTTNNVEIDYVFLEIEYTLPDTTAPTIENIGVTPQYPTCSQIVTICADVTDTSGVSNVRLNCDSSEHSAVSKNMTGVEDHYCAGFSFTDIRDAEVMLCNITATDTLGNYGTSPIPQFTYDCEDPTAVITGDLTCNEGSHVDLSGASSHDSVDTELAYSWTGVTSSEGNSAVVNCVDDGAIEVSLTVTDNVDRTDTFSTTVNVLNVNPVAIITGPTTGNEGSDVILTANVSDVGLEDTHTFKWFVGESTEVSSTEETFSVHCVDEESYLITLEATDDDGGVGTTTHNIQCENVNPVVEAGENQIVNQGSLVTINPIYSDAGVNDILTVEYNWGSEFVSDNTHTYCEIGSHTVTVRVSDDDGGITTDTLTVTVNNVLPIIISTGEPYVGTINELLTFTANAIDVCDSVSYTWNFGEGYSATNTHSWPTKFDGTVGLKVSDGTDVVEVQVPVTVYQYGIQLVQGWNLISIPLIPEEDNTNINFVFGDDISSKANKTWSYTYNETSERNVWNYNIPTEDGLSWTDFASRLQSIIPGYGYYIYMDEEATLYHDGEKYYNIGGVGTMPPQVQLTTGWNLIGHYGTNMVNKSNEIQDLSGGILTDLATVTVLDQDANPITQLFMGKGYWAFVTGEHKLLYAPSQADYY